MDPDIKFTQKRVDESWKEQAEQEKEKLVTGGKTAGSGAAAKTSPAFLQFLQSLTYQLLGHLGEGPQAYGDSAEPEAAREILDVMMALKEKTEGNRSAEEESFFNDVLPQIQAKVTSVS